MKIKIDHPKNEIKDALVMLGLKLGLMRHQLPLPTTKKKIVEVGVSNFFGRWMRKKNWGAFTLPLPYMVMIFYWYKLPTEVPDPFKRVHEIEGHVRQDERNANFLVSWWNYLKVFVRTGYRKHPLEIEAYKIEEDAVKNGLPVWAEPRS